MAEGPVRVRTDSIRGTWGVSLGAAVGQAGSLVREVAVCVWGWGGQ